MRNKIEGQFKTWKENNIEGQELKKQSKNFVDSLHENYQDELKQILDVKKATNTDDLVLGLEIKYLNWLKDIHF